MVDPKKIGARVSQHVAEVRSRINTVTEGDRRWNRLDEAMEAVCEGVIELLDTVGRYDQADEIQSHMAAHERFDLLVELFRTDAAALQAEAEEVDLAADFVYHQEMLKAMQVVADEEKEHRPGA